MCKSPVALIAFNRPEQTKRVIERILTYQPSQVFLIVDAPRQNRSEDLQKCHQVRQLLDQTDWSCQVFKNYAETNLGCKQRVSTGLDWVFSQVESAIILEDDCLPDRTFFQFCEELLSRYRDDRRIFAISGDNFQFGRTRTNYSYYYSLYNHCWGWATWRRAWQYYDVEMRLWETARDGNWLNDILDNTMAVKYWHYKFQQTFEGNIDTWDYQWTLACWLQSGLTILPNVNLVSNIGFSLDDSTHTKNPNSPFANMPVEMMQFPLTHPAFIIRDRKADGFTHRFVFGLWARIYRKFKEKLGI
jgi:hypothetical protein